MNRLEVAYHKERVGAAVASGRWTANRKASLLALIEGGVVTVEQAVRNFGFSAQEIHQMDSRRERFGDVGLKTTQIQVVR